MTIELKEQTIKKFEALLTSAMAQMRVPGLAVAVVKENQLVYSKGFGAKNLSYSLPATPDTLFGIGSITKSFTALAIMQLAEAGKLELTDPISDHIPVFLGDNEDPITIHHLLSHSSGIPSMGSAEVLTPRLLGHPTEPWIPLSSIEDFFVHINGAKDEVVKPGSRYFYFNGGYALLGEIVTRASKMPCEKYVTQKILTPLNMKRSTYAIEGFEKDPNIMTPYYFQMKVGKPQEVGIKQPFHKLKYGSGGIISSVKELTNYLAAPMNDGVWNETPLIGASSLREMHKMHMHDSPMPYFGMATKIGYGYGWGITEDFLGYKLLSHGGSTGASSAYVIIVPEMKFGIAQAANNTQSPTLPLFWLVATLMGKNPDKDVPIFSILKKHAQLVGEYKTYKGFRQISIIKKGSLLHLAYKDFFGEYDFPLIPQSENPEDYRFYMYATPNEKITVEFEVNNDGSIDLYTNRYRLHKVQ